jgi:hypothetical protein
MTLQERINLLAQLGQKLDDKSPMYWSILQKASLQNPWFTPDNIDLAIAAIRSECLNFDLLSSFVSRYKIDVTTISQKVGIVCAGNIPLVGWHDIMCVFLSGHTACIKPSDKDTVLIPYFIDILISLDGRCGEYFILVEKVKDYDAIIATGSNNSALHFEQYFSHVPHIIRRNRNSIAVLSGTESIDSLTALGKDIFYYFGLGCRNVSLICVPSGFDVKVLYEAWEPFKDISNHHKYNNNYEYNLATSLLNKEKFSHNEFVILLESDLIASRIATVHLMTYTDINILQSWIAKNRDQIQCVVSRVEDLGIDTVDFGFAQKPSIDTYADGMDTMHFLTNL